MTYFRFANIKNNTTVINTFNSDNNNIANIMTKNCQIMTRPKTRGEEGRGILCPFLKIEIKYPDFVK